MFRDYGPRTHPVWAEPVPKSNAPQPFTPWKQRKEREGAEDAEKTSKDNLMNSNSVTPAEAGVQK